MTVATSSRSVRRRLGSEPLGRSDGVIATIAAIVLSGLAMWSAPEAFHWSAIPITACGAVAGVDAVRWLRGQFDTFDPRGLIGLFGFYLFFLAPLLFVTRGAELPYVHNPPDWRPWLGFMGLANLVGLAVYRLAEAFGRRGVSRVGTPWRMVHGRTLPVLGLSVCMALGASLYFYGRVGGLGAMATAFFEDPTSLSGLGVPRIISYAFPILTFFLAIIYLREIGWRGSRMLALVMIGATGVLQVAVAGASTARGESLTAIVWAVIATHYLWRRMGRGALMCSGLAILAFMWAYAYYKALGSRLFDYISSGTSVSELSSDTQRTVSALLLGDMSRTGIQAYVVWVQQDHPEAYDKRWGATYLSAVYPIVPYWMWPERPTHAGKVEAGTELLHGRGYYAPAMRAFSSHAYGIAGEAMLNFGLAGVPLAFTLWGFLVGRFRRYLDALEPGDLRFLAVPYGTYFLVTMPLWDMDNYVAHGLIRAGLPLTVLILAVGRWQATQATSSRVWTLGMMSRSRRIRATVGVRRRAA